MMDKDMQKKLKYLKLEWLKDNWEDVLKEAAKKK